MDQRDNVTSVVAITVCKVIQKLMAGKDFWSQADLFGTFFHVCMVPKIHFSYYFLNNLTCYNCNYRRHVAQLIQSVEL